MKISEAITFMRGCLIHNISLIADKQSTTKVVVPYLEGNPGLGKTAAVYTAAPMLLDAFNKAFKAKWKEVEVEVLSLAQYDPSELGGWKIPDESGEHMRTTRPQWMPSGDNPSIVFVDELPQGIVACQNVARQIINERRVGPWHLPENCLVVAAGNPATNKAGTNHIPTHMRDCLCWLEVEADVEDSVRYFHEAKVPPVIPAYLRYRSEMLSKFDRDAKACPSPRSWERVAEILRYDMPDALRNQGIAGTVGPAAASDFIGYLKVEQNLPDMDKLIKDPQGAPIPSDPGILYAVSAHLSSRMDKDNAGPIIEYLNRLTRAEFAGFTVIDAMSRDKTLRRHKAVIDWLYDHKEYILNDDDLANIK